MNHRTFLPAIAIMAGFFFFSSFVSEAQERPLINGTKNCLQKRIEDTLLFIYRDFTVSTFSEEGRAGESIHVEDHARKKTYDLDAGGLAPFFYGIYDRWLFMDEGTGVIRTLYIYDMENDRFCDTLIGVFDYLDITEGKLHLKKLMEPQQIQKLNLPPCENPDIEFSGYVEEDYYDLKTKSTKTETFDCLK